MKIKEIFQENPDIEPQVTAAPSRMLYGIK